MFSICIPNYNYEKYLGRTIQSVLNQTEQDFEIVVADNKSTDGSVAVVEGFIKEGKNLRYVINPCNVGFAGNLDRVAALAQRTYYIMFSSDDVMLPSALSEYKKLINIIGNQSFILTSATDIIDSDDNKIGLQGAKDTSKPMWLPEYKDAQLSQLMACDVYKVPANVMLRQCIEKMFNPFNFCATCYSAESYYKVGGYTSSRLINPDKWFHWKVLSEVEYAYYIDKPLFQYRWHNTNQTAQQHNSGFLKYMIDEYRTIMELTPPMLQKAKMTLAEVESAFVYQDIYRHGLAELGKGRWTKSLRVLLFGLSTYPKKAFLNKYFIPYVLLLMSGPIGKAILVNKVGKKH